LTDGELILCQVADALKIAPCEIRKWPLSDVLMVQRYWAYQHMKREEATAADNPDAMAAMFGR
jgi:hypothetical protein